MIKQLVMWVDGAGNYEGLNFEYLCGGGVRKYFSLPKRIKQIVLCASDRPTKGATEATIRLQPDYYSARICFEGNESEITRGMAAWFPKGTFWFWIEY